MYKWISQSYSVGGSSDAAFRFRYCISLLYVVLQRCLVADVQGAYVGITAGLVVTLWVGIGAQVYKPPVLGHIPPPMNTDQCPYSNVTANNPFTSTTYQPVSTDAVESR